MSTVTDETTAQAAFEGVPYDDITADAFLGLIETGFFPDEARVYLRDGRIFQSASWNADGAGAAYGRPLWPGSLHCRDRCLRPGGSSPRDHGRPSRWLAAAAPVANVTIDSGGSLSGPGAVALAEDNGKVDGIAVASGGKLDVNSGGVSLSAVIRSGGTEVLWGGATGEGDKILSGATEYLMSGATAEGEIVSRGGVLNDQSDILSGQSITATTSETIVTHVDGVTLSVGAALEVLTATISRGGSLTLATGTVGQDLLGRGIDDLHGLVAGDEFAVDQELERFHGIPLKVLVIGASQGREPTGAHW